MLDIVESARGLMDTPGFNWKSLVIGFTVTNFLFDSYVKYRQIRCVEKNGEVIPLELSKYSIDTDTVIKSSKYSLAKLKFSIVDGLYDLVQNLAIFHWDILPKVWTASGCILGKLITWIPSIAGFTQGSVIAQSLVFMGVYSIASVILSIPTKYYHNFVLEESFGFNKLTMKLWASDTIKQLALTFIMGGPILAAMLKIMDKFGDSFMYYMPAFLFAVQIFTILIYPKVILPLFNDLKPLEEGELMVLSVLAIPTLISWGCHLHPNK